MTTSSSKPTQIDLENVLISKLAHISGLPEKTIVVSEPILEMGLDSLIAAHLNNEIEKLYGIELPMEEIVQGATISDLASFIKNQLHTENQSTLDASVYHLSDTPIHSIFDDVSTIPESFYSIQKLPQYKKINMQKAMFKHAGVDLPYYRCFDSASTDQIAYGYKTLINFASYNYLGLNHDPEVNFAAFEAIKAYGTSAASSRIVSGEKSIHRELENTLAQLYQTDDAMVLVSGYSTNVGVISHLMGQNDLIIHDGYSHNSILTGANSSKASSISFPHNNIEALEALLKTHRLNHERVLIVIEGLYSMDGDIPPIQKIIELKKKYKCLLMVDEAHSIGVLGQSGHGIREFAAINSQDVDVWMGTLSKSFAGCGGYIAGTKELIDYLKFSAPGFIFSVGLAPPIAGASLKAIELMKLEPERVRALHQNSQYFLSLAQKNGFDTGSAEGYAIVPIIFGNTMKTAQIANLLFDAGINVQSIIYPGVEEHAARLRFFINSMHTKEQIEKAIEQLVIASQAILGGVNECQHSSSEA